jgi:hypothetical protein
MPPPVVAPFWMEDIYAILATRCVVGMCESVVLTVTTTMLCDYFKGHSRERWLASQTGTRVILCIAGHPGGRHTRRDLRLARPFLVYLVSVAVVRRRCRILLGARA